MEKNYLLFHFANLWFTNFPSICIKLWKGQTQNRESEQCLTVWIAFKANQIPQQHFHPYLLCRQLSIHEQHSFYSQFDKSFFILSLLSDFAIYIYVEYRLDAKRWKNRQDLFVKVLASKYSLLFECEKLENNMKFD